ncbi:MAG: cupin domain-containing protein [Hyphomicrobiaceae bacterium]|nr:cupin domain-containing protein [Hyphomicrobiaceae bacterium]
MTGATVPLAGAGEVIRRLDLAPHPEGGWYRETFRDPAATTTGRACSTAIYFLLTEGETSRWHRVDAAEVWHWYAGAPLELAVSPDAGVPPATLTLSADLASGHAPQIVVPAGHWQQARSLGAWTLVGCTVAPAFEFTGFELAAPDFAPGSRRT